MAKSTIDKETGELLSEPDFVKLYVKDVCKVKGLTTPLYRMFHFMLMNMNYDNIVSYGVNTKRKFLEESGIANSTFDNSVSKLINAGLIERVGRGEFRVNKKYAVKVDWHKVQEIEWTTRYTRSGKIEKVKISSGG
tara:strand:+ start:1187 stop:1594 length:408 start_codon:yes stop_codon:yes gene_type:complete